MQLDHQLIDFDTHYYEPDDCFSRHIERRFAQEAVNVRRARDGLGRVHIGDRRLGFLSVTQSDWMGAPGSLKEYFQSRAINRMNEVLINPRDFDEFFDRAPRLAVMDAQGVEACVMLPTLGVCVEHELGDDVDVLYANLRAFNRWIEEDWGFGADGRIYGVPMLSLVDPVRGAEELARVIARGARVVHLKPGPVAGRSPADPSHDAFWRLAEEAGVVVAFHTGDSGYSDSFASQWSERPRVPLHRYSHFQRFSCMTERPASDTAAALVLQNLFGRFPALNVAFLELGSTWVPPLLANMDKVYWSAPDSETIGGALPTQPSDIFRQHVFVSPFYEDDVVGLVDLLGSARVLLGSDYPHPEGLANPIEFLERLDGVAAECIRRITRDNARELLAPRGDRNGASAI